MNRFVLVRARVLALVIFMLVATHVGAQNLLTNPSFDSDGVGWTSIDGDVTATFLPNVGSTLSGGSGPGSLEIQYAFWNGSSGGVWQEVAVQEGTTYAVGFSAFAPGGNNPATGAPLIIQWFDTDGLMFDWINLNPSEFVNDAWMRVEDSMIAPAGAVVARVTPSVTNPVDPAGTLPGILYIDDIWFAVEGATTTIQEAYYPAGASVAGLAGTFWTTDVWIRSTSGAEVELYGAFLPQGTDNSSSVVSPILLDTIPANGSLVIEDLISELGGDGQTGGVYLRAEAIGGTQLPFLFATSYTSTPNPGAGGSYGQGIPAVGIGVKGITVAPGAFQNSMRRTNAGALNTSAQPIAVRVVVNDRSGTIVGSDSWNLPPYSQRQVSLRNMGVNNLNGGSVVFEQLSTIGSYRAYTSTVDAITGDAVYTEAR